MRATALSRRVALRRAAAVAAVATAGGGRPAAAQETVAGHPVVGTWWVESVPPGSVVLLSTYHADGTYTDGGAPSSPPPPGAAHRVEFFGSGHGVWAPLDGRRAAATLAVYRSDDEGTSLGAFFSRGVVELDDGLDAYRGTWTVEVLDAAGAPVDRFSVKTAGRRMTLRPAEADAPAAGTPGP
jgi:hypothetical protein